MTVKKIMLKIYVWTLELRKTEMSYATGHPIRDIAVLILISVIYRKFF